MRYLFPFLCWAVPAVGLFIACAKKPKPYPPKQYEVPAEPDALAEVPMPDPNERILDLEAPTWSILFDFDSYTLKEAHKAAAVAEFIQKTGQTVFLAGHASEEGPTEYNLALGAQRAVAVRNYLDAYGVPEDRITWQSFGEEKPVTHDPNLQHLNRRVEVIIQKGTP